MRNGDWKELLKYDSFETAFTKFYEKHITLFNQSFPFTQVKRVYRNRNPWLSNDLKSMIKVKNNLYKIYLVHPTNYNRTAYKNHRNTVTYLLRKEEKLYYKNLLLKNKRNLRKTWQVIKDVICTKKKSSIPKTFLINNKETSDKKAIAEHFNNFFYKYRTQLSINNPKQQC